MTLIVAGTDNDRVWMIGETMMTNETNQGPPVSYDVKILRKPHALIGYAGSREWATKGFEHALRTSDGPETLQALSAAALEAQQWAIRNESPDANVDFCYSYLCDSKPVLYEIAPHPKKVSALYLGNRTASRTFAKIHSGKGYSTQGHTSNYLNVWGEVESIPAGGGLMKALVAMLGTVSNRGDGTVGGWLTPFFLSNAGAFAAGYLYNVSMREALGPGRLYRLGTAANGGLTISLFTTSAPYTLAFYCLQSSVGTLYVQDGAGYKCHSITGSPAEFRIAVDRDHKITARTAFELVEPLGADVRCMPYKTSLGTGEFVEMRDKNGNTRLKVTRRPRGEYFTMTSYEDRVKAFKS